MTPADKQLRAAADPAHASRAAAAAGGAAAASEGAAAARPRKVKPSAEEVAASERDLHDANHPHLRRRCAATPTASPRSADP